MCWYEENLYLAIFIIFLLVSFLSITYSFRCEKDKSLIFELLGPSPLYMDVKTEYKEYGIKGIYNGVDISNDVVIDNSKIDVNT